MQLIKQNITAAQAVQVLAANGLTMSEKEARKIVNFLYTLAKTTTTSTHEESHPLHQG
jgi:hypothetical protein